MPTRPDPATNRRASRPDRPDGVVRLPRADRGEGTSIIGPHELSVLLWKERELLELLLYRVVTMSLLEREKQVRWLKQARTEMDAVTQRLRALRLERAVMIAQLSEDWGTIREDATLLELIAGAPQGPFADIFDSHLVALRGLCGELQEQLGDEPVLRELARFVDEPPTGARLLPNGA